MKGMIPLGLLALAASAGAVAHVGEHGMDYRSYKDNRGVSCCNEKDCRPASDYVDTVVNGQPVVRLLIEGAWVSVSRYFVVAEDASDGRAHWCGTTLTAAGSSERRPVPMCVILPPKPM